MNDHALAEQTRIRGRSRVLAQETYARFRASYEVEHGVVLTEWSALDDGTQARWQQMFVPVAEQLMQADEAVRAARFLEEEHLALRARFDHIHTRLAELDVLVARVSQRLPDAALLANLPAPLLAALAPLYNTAPVVGRTVPADADSGGPPATTGSPDAGATVASAGPPSTDAAGAEPPATTSSPDAGATVGSATDAAGPGPAAAPESPASATALSELSLELVAELEAAASAFAAEVASIKLPLASETGTQRTRARVRANASQKLIALHMKARDHLLEILGTVLTEDQRASLWPLPADVFSVAYDVTAVLESLGGQQASATPSSPSSGDKTRRPQPWGRVLQVEERLAAAGLADLDAFTDAQLEQVGGIVAEVLDLDVAPAGLASLGGASVAFTRAFESVRRTTG